MKVHLTGSVLLPLKDLIPFGGEAEIRQREISSQSCLKMGEDLKIPKARWDPYWKLSSPMRCESNNRKAWGEL